MFNETTKSCARFVAALALVWLSATATPEATAQGLPASGSAVVEQILREQEAKGSETVSPVDSARGAEGAREVQEGGAKRVEQEKWNLEKQEREADLLVSRQSFCAAAHGNRANADARMRTEMSPIEYDYCARSGEYLAQFGYDFFSSQVKLPAVTAGAVPDDYMLGIADEVIVTFQGTKSRTITTRVDREGRVMLPEMRPIMAAGRAFGEFRAELESRTASELLGTDVYVSIGKLRSISVVVAGEVTRPGVHQANSLSTVLDALGLAGGIKKTGSLRRIQVLRGNEARSIDLYDLHFARRGLDTRLLDGDRIVVPTIGATLALAGDVKRAGIYELPASGGASLSASLSLAGGTLRPSGYSFVLNRFNQSGLQVLEEVSASGTTVQDGDIIRVARNTDYQSGSVELAGHVRVPGVRPLASAPTVRSLLGGTEIFLPDPYLLFAVLDSTDPATLSRSLRPISLIEVFLGGADVKLRDKDRLLVLSVNDVKYLTSDNVRLVVSTGEYPGQCPALRHLSRLVSDSRSDRFANVIRSVILESSSFKATNVEECPSLYNENPEVLSLALEHVASLNGEVQNPGVYPIAEGTNLQTLMAVAGGATLQLDPTNVELLQYIAAPAAGTAGMNRQKVNLAVAGLEGLRINPGSILRFNALLSDQEKGAVLLSGEFVRPGTYTIAKGERLSELIYRAGGLTSQAFPYGAVFTRESVRRAQEDGFKRSARDLDNALASAALTQEEGSAEMLGAVREIATQLQQAEALGRMVVEADPAVLSVRKELDTILEPGDRLYVPKRPNFVTVVGDVLNPGSLQFVAGKSVRDYVKEAGGLMKSADKKRVFVVYPNGAAEPATLGTWSLSQVLVPPGSVIVAPKDTTPVNTLRLVRDLSQVLSQLAISVASISVISK